MSNQAKPTLSASFRRRPLQHAATVLATAVLLAACSGKNPDDLAASGKAAMAERDYAAAAIQFKSALQLAPDSADLRLQLGLALLEAGDPVSALVELTKAQELQAPDNLVVPPLARAMVMVGDETRMLAQYGQTQLSDPKAQADLLTTVAGAQLLRNDTARGSELLAQALRLAPDYARAIVLQARVKAAEKDLPGALALLDGVLAKNPADEAAGVFKGEVLWLGQRDTKAALEAFKAVIAKNPKAVAAHVSSITILNEQGQRDAARAQFAELKKVAPNHPDTVFFEAQFAFADQDYKKSREYTDRLLKGVPDNARVLELAGAADFRQGRYAEAEAFLGRALKNAPNRLLARQLLAQTYLRLAQPGKAIDVLQPVIEGPTPDGTSLALAGEAFMQLGDAKRADAVFAQAAKVAPDDNRVRTSVALADMARGNTGSAVAQLEAIAAEDKGTRADIALVSARLRANDLPGALKAIDNIEKKLPDKPLAYHLRGRVQLLQRDLVNAAKSFETALAKDAGYFPALASLAAIDLEAGKPEAARARFEGYLRSKPNAHQAHLSLAELAVRTGETPDAVIKHLRNAVKANAGEAQPHLMLITQLAASGDNASALTAAREAAAALPSNPAVIEALGRAQLAANDATSAVTTFKQLTAAQTSNPLYQVRLAEALAATKDNAAARRALEAALKLRPDFAPARRGLVSLAMVEGKPEDALALVRELQKVDPKDASAIFLEGDIHASRRNWEPAIAAYSRGLPLARNTDNVVRLHMAMRGAGRQADADKLAADWLRSSPKDAAFRFYQGDLALGRGDFATAETHYRSVIELQPRNALAMNNVAYLMVRQNKPGALELAKKANELLPGRPQLMDTMALALAADKKIDEAVELQKAAISRAPNSPQLKLTLAKLLIQKGDKAYARAELEELAKLGDRFPEQAQVAQLLKTL
jgi:cellulose synthase operon protein C